MQATFFNKEAYGYPVDFKRWQKNNIGQHRTVDKNSPFQDFNNRTNSWTESGRRIPGADPGFFLGRAALVSCSTSTPINHIVFFFGRIPVVLENRRSSQGDPPLYSFFQRFVLFDLFSRSVIRGRNRLIHLFGALWNCIILVLKIHTFAF